jgi:hypothetical protein
MKATTKPRRTKFNDAVIVLINTYFSTICSMIADLVINGGVTFQTFAAVVLRDFV